jgi:hypothetical protein
MGFQPRDPVEIMLAGHCVIFDHLLRDGARDLLRGQTEAMKLRACRVIHASGKMFLTAFSSLQRMQLRDADKISGQTKAVQPAPPEATAGEPAAVIRPLAAGPPPSTPPRSAPPAAPAKPRFVCERVHPPRRPEPANPRFGAAFRLPGTSRPVPSHLNAPCGLANFRSRLKGTVSQIAMLVPRGIADDAGTEPAGQPAGALVARRDVTPRQSLPAKNASRAGRIIPSAQPAPIDGT